jgi:hypothetical protein
VRNIPTTLVDADGHGFWNKLGNALASDGCWCDDEGLQKNRAAAEKQRQQDAAREQWDLVDSPSAKQWAKDHGGMSPRDALMMGMLAIGGAQAGYAYGPQAAPAPVVEEEGTVIGKVSDLNEPGALRPGEQKLNLPNQGSIKANWAQNSGKLREAMSLGSRMLLTLG